MAARQDIGYCVGLPWSVFNLKVIAQQFGNSLLLSWSTDSLIQHVFDGTMVGQDLEVSAQNIGSPLLHRKQYRYHLLLINGEELVPLGEGLADERDWVGVLGQHRSNTQTTSVGGNSERLLEVR